MYVYASQSMCNNFNPLNQTFKVVRKLRGTNYTILNKSITEDFEKNQWTFLFLLCVEKSNEQI